MIVSVEMTLRVVLAIFCCYYDCGANAAEAVEKITVDDTIYYH